ncbi:MAG: hypothetical protein C7K11_06370 [Candidatus Amulumruptor caecigallinarius]|nr:MAG: hypothetical protein C7K11_06370 [Candidatus Amulumruptor caecigallinarius]
MRAIIFTLLSIWTIYAFGYNKNENLLSNGDFTEGLDGWETRTSDNPNFSKVWVEDGVCYLKAGGSSASWGYYTCAITQTMKLNPGKYKCSFNYNGGPDPDYGSGFTKIFRIIVSTDDIIDTSDDYLINETRGSNKPFASEYSFTIFEESYVMFLLSMQTQKSYTLSISDCRLTRELAFLEPEAISCDKEYGDENPNFETKFNGVIPGDESLLAEGYHASYECEATRYSSIGSYPIKVSCDGNVDGYEIKRYRPGTLSITAAPILVSCPDLTREYGEDNPIPEIHYSGFKNGENEEVLTKAASYEIQASRKSNVGTYPIALKDAESPNYKFEYDDACLIITKAALNASINNTEKIYGDNNPQFSLTYEGLKNEETSPYWVSVPKFVTDANSASTVGDYIVSATDFEARNYMISRINNGILSILPKNLILKANDASKLYFEDNPPLDYKASGFVNGDDKNCLTVQPTLQTNAVKNSEVGNYSIAISGAESPNYTINYVNGNLSIGKRTLTIKADDKERPYKTENPELTYTISGFVNNESAQNLKSAPIISTEATLLSDCGEYEINIGNADATNYSFNYIKGMLTITKINQTITWEQDFNNVSSGDQIELLASTDSGLEIDYIISGNVSEYKSGNRTFIDCLAPGKVTIRATQEGNINYNPAVRVVKTFVIPDDASSETIFDDLKSNLHIDNGYLIGSNLTAKNIEIIRADGCVIYSGIPRDIFIGNGLFIIKAGEKYLKVFSK